MVVGTAVVATVAEEAAWVTAVAVAGWGTVAVGVE
jgi:hypothetical protein